MIYLYEEQFLWLIQTHLSQCRHHQHLLDYARSAQSRVSELPLLPLQDHGDDNSKNAHMDQIMEKLVANPLHNTALLYRTVRLVPGVLESLESCQLSEEAGMVREMFTGGEFTVVEEDLSGSMDSLLRIQFTYRLDPLDLTRGLVQSTQTEARLSSELMYQVFLHSYYTESRLRPGLGKQYALAVEWLEALLESVKTDTKHMLNVSELEETLDKLRLQHDTNFKAPSSQSGRPHEQFFVERIYKNGVNRTGRYLRSLEQQVLEDMLEDGGLTDYQRYARLCRGDHHPEISLNGCLLHTNGSPYFLLAPLHLEILSQSMMVLAFHDLLTSEEVKFLKFNSMSELKVVRIYVTVDQCFSRLPRFRMRSRRMEPSLSRCQCPGRGTRRVDGCGTRRMICCILCLRRSQLPRDWRLTEQCCEVRDSSSTLNHGRLGSTLPGVTTCLTMMTLIFLIISLSLQRVSGWETGSPPAWPTSVMSREASLCSRS